MRKYNGNNMKIYKTDKSHNTATFVVLEPDSVDRNWDKISENEIIKTAHEFMFNLDKKWVNVNHEKGTDVSSVFFVESFVAPVDIESGAEIIKKWSWLVGMKFPEEIYKKVLSWDIVWISMEWSWFEKI